MHLTFATVVLSSLVAQASAMPAPTASAAATATAAADELNVRRGPASAPRMLPPSVPTDATIRNSGSTNTQAYTVVVHPDRTADVTVDGETSHASVATAQARWLFTKLRAAGPLDAIATRHCMKSSSFGSATTIAFDGHTSPDLTCTSDATARELVRTANAIVAQLGIGAMRSRGRLVH